LWHKPHNECLEQPDTGANPTERTRLLGPSSQVPPSKDVKALCKTYKEKSGVRDLFYEIFRGHGVTTENRLRLLCFTMIVVALSSALIASGYFLTKIKLDGPARLDSERCGLWLSEGGKRSEAATRARMLDLEKEERAAQFAQDCYGRPDQASSRCKFLHRPILPVSKNYTNDRPFAAEICLFNQTVTFKTPTIDAKELGINSLSTPKFHRSTACTPLSMTDKYIESTTTNNITTYTYHYGNKSEGGEAVNHTCSTVGNPWDQLAPVYDVFAYISNADDADNPVWKPHDDPIPPPGSTVTIIFVSSLRILYEQRSDDPIFPADQEFPLAGSRKPCFRNSDPRARPLACVNTIEICTPDGETCWSINSDKT
jgi:hypothetical protein